jgi:hypothetical protein
MVNVIFGEVISNVFEFCEYADALGVEGAERETYVG